MLQRRMFSSSLSAKARGIAYAQHGDPTEVLQCISYDLKPPESHEVRVRFRLSALNPADMNAIEGTYPAKPPKREDLGGMTIVGNEAVAVVVGLGDGSSSNLEKGDWVIAGKSQLGTWCSEANIPSEHLIKVPRSHGEQSGTAPISEVQAAMLGVNPATAFRMLKDYVNLGEGAWIVQNGANSAAGTAVIQLCKAWGINSINIVRDRDRIDDLRSRLTSLGATHILTTSELEDSKAVRQKLQEWTGGAPVRLGLNCVCGPSTTHLATRILSDQATLVTYGAMSKQPLSLPPSLFIFKELHSTGFWLSKWYETQGPTARAEMARELVQLIEGGHLKEAEHEIIELKGDDEAITQAIRRAAKRSTEGFGGKKLLIRFVD